MSGRGGPQLQTHRGVMSDPIAFGISAGYVAALLVLAELLRRREVLPRRVVRAVVHVGVAAWIVPTALWFDSAVWAALLPLLFAGVNVFCWLTGRFRAFSEPGEQTAGIVFHPVAIAAVILLFWPLGARSIAVASVLVMGWADPLAALVGGAVRSPSFKPLGERKSVAGSMTMFLAALIVLKVVSVAAGEPLGWAAALGLAAVATVAELLSVRGSDNLSVTWTVAAMLWLLGWGGAG